MSNSPEFDMDTSQVTVTAVAELDFATGKVGERERLPDAEARARFAGALGEHSRDLTVVNTADCGDDRRILGLADGTDDPEILRARVAPQLFGGLGLATMKAVVAADASVIRDARNAWDAYLKVSKTLQELGEEDGGHENCGASLSVESSVANEIDPAILVPSIFLIAEPVASSEDFIKQNIVRKRRLLANGFYSGWDPQRHADYLASEFPQNFAHLAVDHDDKETGGHHGAGVYLIGSEGRGFAKNAFIDDTGGQEAFAVTLPKMRQIARMLGVSEEERQRIMLGFIDDTLHVGGGIVTEGTPVFSDGTGAPTLYKSATSGYS